MPTKGRTWARPGVTSDLTIRHGPRPRASFRRAIRSFRPITSAAWQNRAPGCIAYWPLDETSGSVAPNLVAGGAEGSLQRSPRWTTRSRARSGAELGRPQRSRDRRQSAGDWCQRRFHLVAVVQAGSVRNDNAVIVGNRAGGQQDPLQFIKFTPTNFEFYSGAADPILPYSLGQRSVDASGRRQIRTGPDLLRQWRRRRDRRHAARHGTQSVLHWRRSERHGRICRWSNRRRRPLDA